MRVVLDASAAVEVALNRGKEPALAAILDESEEILAPDLLVPEVVNAIWKEHQLGGLGLAICEEALAVLLDFVDTWVPSRELYREAFALSRAQRARAAYDMFYLALAQREDAVLLTLDGKLKKEAKRAGIRVA